MSARRWLKSIHPVVGCHYYPPGLRLPSQPKSVTAHRPVPNYTAWWNRHMGVLSSLTKAVTWKRTGRDLNSRPLGSRANALPLSHTGHVTTLVFVKLLINLWRFPPPENVITKSDRYTRGWVYPVTENELLLLNCCNIRTCVSMNLLCNLAGAVLLCHGLSFGAESHWTRVYWPQRRRSFLTARLPSTDVSCFLW